MSLFAMFAAACAIGLPSSWATDAHADGDDESHDQSAANAWAAHFFGHYLEERQDVTSGCDHGCCTALCVSAEVAGETACILEIFGEPECGIACAVAGQACDAACPTSVEVAPNNTTEDEQHYLAKVIDADGDGKSHDQSAANAWAAQFLGHYFEERQDVTSGCDHGCCTALCFSAEVACEGFCALEIFGEPECGIACAAVGQACSAECPTSVEVAPINTTEDEQHSFAKVIDADGDGMSHDQPLYP